MSTEPADITVVLVVDIVASTVLREHLGESRFAELKSEFDAVSRGILAKHRGQLVKDQGDGFMAALTTASDALAVGIAILQATATSNRRHSAAEQLRLRLGASAGECSRSNGDLTGFAPVEATRLEASADPDTLVCSDLVRALAGRHSPFHFLDERELRLKGLREPVRAWRVGWQARTTSERLGIPEALTIDSRLPFVGRGNELDRLTNSWESARRGDGRLATIAGEPGVGKTRLCSELSRRTLDDGGIVLYGRCDQLVPYPYQPFVEALERYVRHAEQLEVLSADQAAELARLVPAIRDHRPDLGDPEPADGDTQRHLLFEAVAGWLQFVAREDPVLFVLDDLTWATAPTLAMLHHITPRLSASNVLLVGTYRLREATDPVRDVLAAIRRRIPVESIVLGGLGEHDVLDALGGMLGEETLTPSVAALGSAVWRRSGGNPFYVGELFASLLDDQSIELGDDGWTTAIAAADVSVPAGVGDIVLQRQRTLSPRTQRVLSTASVAGVTFDPRVVREIVDLPPDAFADALDEAMAAGLVRALAAERYEFAHALVRDVLYDELSMYRRSVVHEGVARAIESVHGGALDEHADDLALHYSRSSSADGAARAVWYGAVAARRASDRFAYGEAVAHYQRALQTLAANPMNDDDRTRCGLIVDLGVAQHRAGDSAGHQTLLEGSRLAAAAGDGALCARAVLASSRGIFSSTGRVDHERVDALRSALTLIGGDDSRVRAMLLANLSVELEFSGDHHEQDRLSDEAAAIARRLDDPAALVPVLALRMVTLWRADRLEERLALAVELEQLCAGYGRPQATLLAAYAGNQAAMEAGDFATADRRLATIDEIAAALRQPLALGYARLRQSMRAAVDGRLDDSERLADEAYGYARASGQPDASAFWVGHRFNIRFHQGRLDEITDELATAAEDYPGIVAFRAAMAMVAADLDRPDEARRSLDKLFGPGGSGVPDDLNWLTTIAFATQAAALVGDRHRCAELLGALLPFRGQFVDNGTTFNGSVERYVALALSCLGHRQQAEAAFANASNANARLDAPILSARTALEWAEATMCSDVDDSSIRFAREKFGEALTIADRLSLATIARRARRGLGELADSGR